jgi:hypothetical protein
MPNGRNIFQMSTEYISLFNSKALQNLPSFGIFGLKIWQPSGNPGQRKCLSRQCVDSLTYRQVEALPSKTKMLQLTTYICT